MPRGVQVAGPRTSHNGSMSTPRDWLRAVRAPGEGACPASPPIGLETFVAVTVMFGIAAAALRGRALLTGLLSGHGRAHAHRSDRRRRRPRAAPPRRPPTLSGGRPPGQLPRHGRRHRRARRPCPGTCGRGSPSAARCRTPRGSGRRTRASGRDRRRARGHARRMPLAGTSSVLLVLAGTASRCGRIACVPTSRRRAR